MSLDPLMARPRNPNTETSELLVTKIPKKWLDLFDAEAFSRGESDRQAVVREVLEAFVIKQAAKWTVYSRVLGGNEVIEELAGMVPNRFRENQQMPGVHDAT